MKSSFFYDGHYKTIAEKLKDCVNGAPEFLSAQTARSTRAAGDAIEAIIADKFDTFLGDWCKEYSSDFARRAMADVAFKDKEDFYCEPFALFRSRCRVRKCEQAKKVFTPAGGW